MPRSVLPPDLRDASAEERAELEQVWSHLGDAPAETTPAETDAAWDRLASRLRLDAEPSPSERPRRAPDRPASRTRRRFPTRPFAIGVAALALVALAVVTVPALTEPLSVTPRWSG